MNSIKKENIINFLNGRGKCFIVTQNNQNFIKCILNECIDMYDEVILVSDNCMEIFDQNNIFPYHNMSYDMIKEFAIYHSGLLRKYNKESCIFIFTDIDIYGAHMQYIKILQEIICPKTKYMFSSKSIYDKSIIFDLAENRIVNL